MEKIMSEIKEVILELLKEDTTKQIGELEYNKTFSEYRVASITLINLAILLEIKYDIVFEDEELDFSNKNTIKLLAAFINERISSK